MSGRLRLGSGVPGLDEHLGGGLIPGTLTVVVGASGIGKTQLGLQFAQAGLSQEGRRGVLFDMNARIDPQSHAEYAERMFSWRLDEAPAGSRRARPRSCSPTTRPAITCTSSSAAVAA